MDAFQDCLIKPRTDEQYSSKTVNDRTTVIAFITASRIIIPASGVWHECFCFLTCDTVGAQIKIFVRGVSRISRESRVVSLYSVTVHWESERYLGFAAGKLLSSE